MKLLLILLLFSAPAFCGWKKTLYRVSQVVLVAATTADAASSYDQPELNPILGQRFGARGISIKAGVAAGMFIVEEIAVRKGVDPRFPTVINFAGASVFGYGAVHNWRLKSGR